MCKHQVSWFALVVQFLQSIDSLRTASEAPTADDGDDSADVILHTEQHVLARPPRALTPRRARHTHKPRTVRHTPGHVQDVTRFFSILGDFPSCQDPIDYNLLGPTEVFFRCVTSYKASVCSTLMHAVWKRSVPHDALSVLGRTPKGLLQFISFFH